MIRATVCIKSPGGGTAGWLLEFAALPSVGDDILLLDGGGEDCGRGRVSDIRHLLHVFPSMSTGDSQMVEVFVDADQSERPRREDDPETILRWIEAGFPPWGCHNCRGAEYGPSGEPCPECRGHSDQMEPPERAAKILEAYRAAVEAKP